MDAEKEMEFYHKMQLMGIMPNPHIEKYDSDGFVLRSISRKKYMINYSIQKHTHSYLRNIYVVPEYRNEGIGEKVMEWYENTSKKNGFNEIQLEAEPNSIRFFEKLGYKLTGEPKNRMKKII